MTIHYHGTPITPVGVLKTLAGRCFCVSYAAPAQVAWCHEFGQSVMLDNGAFTFWKTGKPVDWLGYYRWCEVWLRFHTTWAVIPDVIDGGEEANDRLIELWPHGDRGAPVWHMNESLDRLKRLTAQFSKVCIGSAGDYAVVGDKKWHARMHEAMNSLCGLGPAPSWLHMLRGMAQSGSEYPFASTDSTDIARNHCRPQNDAVSMANRWDRRNCPAAWVPPAQVQEMFG